MTGRSSDAFVAAAATNAVRDAAVDAALDRIASIRRANVFVVAKAHWIDGRAGFAPWAFARNDAANVAHCAFVGVVARRSVRCPIAARRGVASVVGANVAVVAICLGAIDTFADLTRGRRDAFVTEGALRRISDVGDRTAFDLVATVDRANIFVVANRRIWPFAFAIAANVARGARVAVVTSCNNISGKRAQSGGWIAFVASARIGVVANNFGDLKRTCPFGRSSRRCTCRLRRNLRLRQSAR